MMKAVPISAAVDGGGAYAEVGVYDVPSDVDPLAKDDKGQPLYRAVRTFVVRPQADDGTDPAAIVAAMFARGLAQAQEVVAELAHQAALATAAQSLLGQAVTL